MPLRMTRTVKVLEPEHGSSATFDGPMVLFHHVVQILDLPNLSFVSLIHPYMTCLITPFDRNAKFVHPELYPGIVIATEPFLFIAKRDEAAARRFFDKAIAKNGAPETVTIDKSGSNLAALHAVNAERETLIKGLWQNPTVCRAAVLLAHFISNTYQSRLLDHCALLRQNHLIHRPTA
jgi:hypothetical protein